MKRFPFGSIAFIILLLITSSKTFAQRLPRIKNSTAVCDASVFNYTATSAVSNVTYTWSRPTVPGITNAAQNGTTANIKETLVNTTNSAITVNYIFTMTPLWGCIHMDTLKVNVVPIPSGVIEITPSNSIYWGDKRTINFKSNDIIPYNYTWSFGDGMMISTNSNPVVHYYYSTTKGDGTLKVDIKNQFGCIKSFSTTITLMGDSTTGQSGGNPVPKNYSLAAYPIPFSTTLYLKYTLDATQKARYIVNDLAGRIVYNEEITLLNGSNNIVLPSNKMMVGITYVIKIKSNNIDYEEKVFRK